MLIFVCGVVFNVHTTIFTTVCSGLMEDPPKQWDEFIPSEEDKRVRINACATMWHENSEEIQVCLKSVFQMDKYINNRRKDDHERSEWQKWDWQTHIFFDDCMKKSRTEKVKI